MEEDIIHNPIIGDKVRFIATAQQTGGSHTEVEVSLAPGGGTPLHYHKRFYETFTALEGELGLELDGKRQLVLAPGNSYAVSTGMLHRFHNPGTHQIKFRVVLEPADEGFEQALRIMYGLAADGLTDKRSLPKNFFHSAVVLSLGDNHGPGVLTWLAPVFKWAAKRARKNGVQEKLISRYCKKSLDNLSQDK